MVTVTRKPHPATVRWILTPLDRGGTEELGEALGQQVEGGVRREVQPVPLPKSPPWSPLRTLQSETESVLFRGNPSISVGSVSESWSCPGQSGFSPLGRTEALDPRELCGAEPRPRGCPLRPSPVQLPSPPDAELSPQAAPRG